MIFVDSSFWLALNRPRDEDHAEAVTLAGRELGPLVTSDRVLEETWTLVLRRTRRHDLARRVTSAIRETEQVRLVPIADEVATRSWAWLDAHDEHFYSFVDASSFALMQSLGVDQVLTFDNDFAAAGFVVVRDRGGTGISGR